MITLHSFAWFWGTLLYFVWYTVVDRQKSFFVKIFCPHQLPATAQPIKQNQSGTIMLANLDQLAHIWFHLLGGFATLTCPDWTWILITHSDGSWSVLTRSNGVHLFDDLSWSVLTCPEESWIVLTSPDPPWIVLTHLDMICQQLTCQRISHPVLTFPGLSWL